MVPFSSSIELDLIFGAFSSVILSMLCDYEFRTGLDDSN